MISQLEKDLRIERRRLLNEAIKKFGIKTSALSLITGISDGNISNYKTGASEITEENWGKLQKGIEAISNEQPPLPNIEVEKWDYVAQQLKNQGNVVINKNKIKNIAQYMIDLKLNGFDCNYEVANDGYIISLSKNSKPMVEKVIQPKQEVEPIDEIIVKSRKMHEDALVLHEKALKIQESTEEILKEATINLDEPEYKMPKFVPGGTIEFIDPNFVPTTKTYSPMDDIQITITDEDIIEAVEHNQKKMHTIPPEEEVEHYDYDPTTDFEGIYEPTEEEKGELKELADEVLANCGLEKGIHTLDLIKFLETRSSKQEVGGFIRFKAIESLLEDDYQTASMCINYFMDNGYVPEEKRL